MSGRSVWPRPVPVVGDVSSAEERAATPQAWALPPGDAEAIRRVISARRDIRRFRADPVPEAILARVLEAAHRAPSVGHSQPWRFVIVTEPATRAAAAVMADRCRLAQAAAMDTESGRHLLDLDLEGIREAPLGVVVCCDRRVPPAGVLGRATFADADLWSCACAIENLWLAARAEGLGVGWVTLFEPDGLGRLVGAPPGVVTLGWLCVGWPDERPPSPGLERRGWSTRLDLADVILRERWPGPDGPPPPGSRLAPPGSDAVVAAHDSGDNLLTPPGSLGILDRSVDRVLAATGGRPTGGQLVLAAADHPVARLGVTAYRSEVTRAVVEAATAGSSLAAVAAVQAGLELVVVDAGLDGPVPAGVRAARPAGPRGDLRHRDALTTAATAALLSFGAELAREAAAGGHRLLAVGEAGVGNTTVAAALAAGLLACDPAGLVGLGAGSDSAIAATKTEVVTAAVARAGSGSPEEMLARLGGPELVVLCGLMLGAAESGAVVVLDGMATGTAALAAVAMEPAVAAHLVAGQRSRERGHPAVLAGLGLEPLLDLRVRAGEGVGAAMAVSLLRTALAMRRDGARTEARR